VVLLVPGQRSGEKLSWHIFKLNLQLKNN